MKPTTVRIILTLALHYGWPIRRLYINNAFLQGHLEDDVYMEQPPRFIDDASPTHVFKLRKTIDGLRQASHAWYTELRNFLLTQGFKNSRSDTSLFIFHQNGLTHYLLVYVDNIIITRSSLPFINKFIDSLVACLSLKDLGNFHYFLGVEALTTPSSMLLTRRKYIHDLLGKHNIAIDYKFLHDQVLNVASSNQLVDSLTQSLH